MPIYEYRCLECGNVFEEIVSGSKADGLSCPQCSSARTEKLMSRIGGISMGKGAGDFSCASGGACPGATSCGAGGSCPNL